MIYKFMGPNTVKERLLNRDYRGRYRDNADP